jgi:hypothetical protein
MKTARISIFLAAAAIIGLGLLGVRSLEKDAAMAFLLGCLTLGGGFLITGLFSLKMPWHGVLGAGVLAMLGLGRGFLNFPDFAKFLSGDHGRGTAPVLEFGVAIICAFLVLRVYRAWSQERIRRTIDP